MPDSKITALTALTAADPANDMFPVVDVSDTTMAASGTTKRISINNILACSPSATLASATITGDLTVDTNVLKVDSSGNRVSVNTTTFATDSAFAVKTTAGKFDIRAAGSLSIKLNSDQSMLYNVPTGNSHLFQINDSDAMTLNASGLGVGVASPSYKLDVRGSDNSVIAQFGGTNRQVRFVTAANGGFDNANFIVRHDSSVGGFLWQNNNGSNTLLTIDSSGNVGIGVTPSAWNGSYRALQIGATGALWQSASGFTFLSDNAFVNSGAANTYITTAAASFYRQNAGVHTWWNAPSGTAGNAITFTQAMTLDASGNLLVGTTVAGGNRLNVQTASGDCTTLIKSQAANVNSAIDYVTNYGNHTIRKSGTAVWDYGVINDSSATPAFKVSNASAVGVQLVSGATSWTTLSDETMKDIIEPISNAVSKVGSLRSVIGKFKTDDASKRRSFLIAQDVQSVLPEAVDVIGENNELGLRYTEVIPLLVAAIKELTARVQTLEAK